MNEETQGFAFPFQIDSETGGVKWEAGSKKIRSNIRILLGTREGERAMLRNFGTKIQSLAHEPNDDVLADLIQTQVQRAILQWEPRVIVTGAVVEQTEELLQLRLTYVSSSNPLAEEMVIPIL